VKEKVTSSRKLDLEGFVGEFLAAQERDGPAYEPREDTFLMLDALSEQRLEGSRVLDMGTGSGILASYCARRSADVTAADIDNGAIDSLRRVAKRLGIELKLVVSDLFSGIQGMFDLVVFNPPYLPSSSLDDRAVDGGEQGTRVIGRFLAQLREHLTEDGLALLLVSSLNNPEELVKSHADLAFEPIHNRALFFERLYVMKVKRRKSSVTQQ